MSEKLISTNPARGYEAIDHVTITSNADIKKIVERAQSARETWRAKSFDERAVYLQKFINLFKKHQHEIAELETKEMGKPIRESLSKGGNIAMMEHYLKTVPDLLAPQVLDEFDTHQTELHFEPYGVVASIAPWNFPAGQFILEVFRQIFVGNVVVFKHSEECPLTGKFLADLMDQAGFPEGVFTAIHGPGMTGATLLEQNINFISFTGSSGVGQVVYEKAAEKFIPALLEMGGSSPGIVFEDVDINDAGPSVFIERFFNCGQVCCALKRAIVHESIYDAFVEKLVEEASKQVIGDPMDEKTTVGPLVAKRQLELLEEQVEDARKKGATILTGGKRPEGLDGAYYEPTIITDTTPDMRVITEETFGPVLPVITFKTEEEALEIAHATEYGLSGFVYSKNIERAMRVAQALEAGSISINGCPYFSLNAPFGGYKKSGIGRTEGGIAIYDLVQKKVIARPK